MTMESPPGGEPGAAQPPDRRASPRRTLEVGIGLHSDSQIFSGYSEDLSDGGVFVATYESLERGSRVTLDLELPTGARIRCRGRVAWARNGSDLHQPGLGIAFEDLSASDRDAILTFVRARPALFYDIDAGSEAGE